MNLLIEIDGDVWRLDMIACIGLLEPDDPRDEDQDGDWCIAILPHGAPEWQLYGMKHETDARARHFQLVEAWKKYLESI